MEIIFGCPWCCGRVPWGKKRYCSDRCAKAAHNSLARLNRPKVPRKPKKDPAIYKKGTFIIGQERRLYAIHLFGGVCTECGYKRNSAALHFHHIDPAQKLFDLTASDFLYRSPEEIALEIEKCTVLCANCHTEHHNPQCNLEELEKAGVFENIRTALELKAVDSTA
jgi:5-methylcytosine-specific restriction endonuclease McrA